MFKILKISLITSLLVVSAEAHEAKMGWQYDAACCNDRDCRQLAPGTVKSTSEGYVWEGHTFKYGSKRIRHSGDQHFHGCQDPLSKRFICLYIPAGGV